jgi:GTP-binding protein EngB required for normal cell division
MTERNTMEYLGSSAGFQAATSLATEIIECFGLSDLSSLLQAVELQQRKQDLNVAVLGRFKAGKSSFLNDLIGKPLLPVGVVPVTAVVTEIAYGEQQRADIVFQDGQTRSVPASEIKSYISESDNPQNVKRVEDVRVFLPSLVRYRGIRLDTPGLESIFEHNTEAALSWTPNVDMAVVAIGVDPPLTQQDIALIERLYQYTPNVSVLLTKVDILTEPERKEVEQFISSRLQERFNKPIPVFPYSIKPGYELLRKRFEEEQILRPLASAHLQHRAILGRKLRTLLLSAEDYLQLSEKAASRTAAEREQLREQILGSREFLADQKLQLQLLAKHAAGKTRSAIDTYLQQTTRRELEEKLKERLRGELPGWHGGFSKVLTAFERWLRRQLTEELTAVSAAHQSAFCEPLKSVQAQCQRNLQSFRDQLSDKVMRLFGTPLRTSETEIEIQAPRSPDISVGKVFDHSWEVISFLIPMPLVRWAIERRFYDRVEREVYKHLSRLTTQWEEKIQAAIFKTAKEAELRFDELITTINHLLSGEDLQANTKISFYLGRVREMLKQLS